MTLPPALLHKLGPLPVWAWGGIIGVGGLAAVAVFGGHKSSSVKSSGQQFATAPAGDSGGGGSAFGFPAGVGRSPAPAEIRPRGPEADPAEAMPVAQPERPRRPRSPAASGSRPFRQDPEIRPRQPAEAERAPEWDSLSLK